MTYQPELGAALLWILVLGAFFGVGVLLTWHNRQYGGSDGPPRTEPAHLYSRRRQTMQSDLHHARRVGDTAWAEKLEAAMRAEGMRIDATPGLPTAK